MKNTWLTWVIGVIACAALGIAIWALVKAW